MEQLPEVRYCKFSAASPGPYAQYLLPHIVSQARWNPDRFVTLGAAWRGYAVGAAAVTLKEPRPDGTRSDTASPDRAGRTDTGAVNPDEAVLNSLFVDPKARGQGIGTGLLRLAAEEAGNLGAEALELSYTMPGPEIQAMDHIVSKLGGKPEFSANVYTVESANFHDSPLFGWTLTPDFRPAAPVKSFRDLSREQIDRLNENPDIPVFLRPAARKAMMDPALSVAWVEDGEVVCFQLISHSGPGSYAGLSSWRSDRAPGDAFVHLLSAVANLCYYDAGGDFLFHGMPINERSEALTRSCLGDLYTLTEEHQAYLWLPLETEEAEKTGEAAATADDKMEDTRGAEETG